MKRCPECRREYDNTMMFCLDDGAELLYGPASPDEPQTAILHSTDTPGEAGTRPQLHTTAHSDGQVGDKKRTLVAPKRNTLIAGVLGILLVTALGTGGYLYYGRSTGKQISSIAVMPFVNDSGNAELDYLSDGMTETLIRNLSPLPNLNVKARSSVFRYKGKDTDAKTVGRELGVQAVLNGRVIQRGDRLSLNLELIDTATENVIWTDEYDRRSTDLVSLQNEIARDVSSRLRLKLSGADQQRLAKNYTVDPEAYRLYLQGRFYGNKRAGPEFRKAEGFFMQAIEKDPNFALGYVGLADYVADRDKAKEYVNRALQLDPDLPEAIGTLGYQYMLDYDWVNAERYMKRSLELDQKNPDVYRWNGQRLMMLGRFDEAFAAYDKALELDPNSSNVRLSYGACLIYSGKLNEGIRYLEDAVKADPTFIWLHAFLGHAYLLRNDYANAVEQLAIAQEMGGRPEDARLVHESFATGGREGFLREMIRRRDLATNPSDVGSPAAAFYAQLGEKEKALQILERVATRKGDFWLFNIKYEAVYDPLRGDPRFQALLKIFDAPI